MNAAAHQLKSHPLWLAVALAILAGTPTVWADDPLAHEPKWPAPKVKTVRQQALELLQSSGADEATLEKAATFWQDVEPGAGGPLLLDRFLTTVALGNAQVAAMLEQCVQSWRQPALPEQNWLDAEDLPPQLGDNARLLYGRWLVQERMYDEAREQLAGLQPQNVIDPTALLFYRAVVHHRLLDKSAALSDIDGLLTETPDPPQRFVALAKLMRDDIKDLEQDSLDHIARRMDDIQRRLDLGHAGPKVRSVEDGVIESLDKLIEELEKQQQQQQQQQAIAGGQGSNQPSKPADESQILGGSGPGQIAKRGMDERGGWGDLPPKEREAALQQIGKDFPAHYRDTIEQYFRRLASEDSEAGTP